MPIPFVPVAIVTLNVIARTATIIVAINVISKTAVELSKAIPNVKQGWRDAKQQRHKPLQLTHNKEFDHGAV